MARWKHISQDRIGDDPPREQSIRNERRLLDLEVALSALRQRRGLSQQTLASVLQTSQPNVSRIERQDDIQLSTLAHYIQGLGGRLEVRAVFEDEDVPLTTV